jgi:hypothetical protein
MRITIPAALAVALAIAIEAMAEQNGLPVTYQRLLDARQEPGS